MFRWHGPSLPHTVPTRAAPLILTSEKLVHLQHPVAMDSGSRIEPVRCYPNQQICHPRDIVAVKLDSQAVEGLDRAYGFWRGCATGGVSTWCQRMVSFTWGVTPPKSGRRGIWYLPCIACRYPMTRSSAGVVMLSMSAFRRLSWLTVRDTGQNLKTRLIPLASE